MMAVVSLSDTSGAMMMMMINFVFNNQSFNQSVVKVICIMVSTSISQHLERVSNGPELDSNFEPRAPVAALRV